MNQSDPVLDSARRYCGDVRPSSTDLGTGACYPAEAMPEALRVLLDDVHPEVEARFYGCGSPPPLAPDGCTVPDLGCGSGRDVYLASQLVDERGRVIGVDMPPEQRAVARGHQDWHAQRYGHGQSNVAFRDGVIEDLAGAGIADASVDVAVSNCVRNLSPEKPRAFAGIFRVLKPGGELYVSDVFVDRRIPPALRRDPVLPGACLAGAPYTHDVHCLTADIGCADARIVSQSPVSLLDPQIEATLGMVGFRSLTARAIKLTLEDRCEDHGQVATYPGGIDAGNGGHRHAFVLDDHHRFETGRPMPVCGNTAGMLASTRYAPYVRIDGDRSVHFGLFDCGPAPASIGADAAACC